MSCERACAHVRVCTCACGEETGCAIDVHATGKIGRNSPLEISMAGKSSLISGLDVGCILKVCIFSNIDKSRKNDDIFDCELLL